MRIEVYLVFQRYKFKSKSQLLCTEKAEAFGVFGISKVQIQKQITTVEQEQQRESGCIWYFKGTNSKANHNT